MHCLTLSAGVASAVVLSIASGAGVAAAEPPQVEFQSARGQLVLSVAGETVATYVYDDQEITRPHFANVRAPGGIQVTRSHPPIEGVDATDHATYHPGIWMAFGDLGGSDYWRNTSRVVHEGFSEAPRGGAGHGTFRIKNRYLAQEDPRTTVCLETCRMDFHVRPGGYLLLWDSTFSNDERNFAFGDQEEMGLGVRVATPIAEQNGGTIRDDQGRTTAGAIWGQTAAWCDYSGEMDGRHVGATLMCHPENFRKSWMHVRDYGLVTANAFGRAAFGKGPASSVVVEKGMSLRLRYGVLLHASPEADAPDIAAAYADFVELANRLQ